MPLSNKTIIFLQKYCCNFSDSCSFYRSIEFSIISEEVMIIFYTNNIYFSDWGKKKRKGNHGKVISSCEYPQKKKSWKKTCQNLDKSKNKYSCIFEMFTVHINTYLIHFPFAGYVQLTCSALSKTLCCDTLVTH